MDALATRYQGRVKFLLLYSYEAHPEQLARVGIDRTHPRPVAEALTVDERGRFARDLRDLYQVQRQIVVDDFDEKSVAWQLLGRTSYSFAPLVVLDVDGKPALYLERTAPEELDDFLSKLLAAGGRLTHPQPAPPGTPPG
jgi:hypothetical protein